MSDALFLAVVLTGVGVPAFWADVAATGLLVVAIIAFVVWVKDQ